MPSFSPFWSSLEGPPPQPPRLIFTDPSDNRVIEACKILKSKKLADPILVTPPTKTDRAHFASLLLERQKKQNLSTTDVESQLNDPLYQGVAMLLDKQADGLIGGSLRPTADIVRVALQCIGPKPGVRLVSGHFLLETESHPTADNTPFLLADCAVMPEPSPRALASTAISAAESFQFFTGQTPKIALLSFSTRGSAVHPLVDRIKETLEIVRKLEPNLTVDGEIQVDAALDANVAAIKKAGDSALSGRANVLIFPTLEAGNIGYKLVQRFSNARIAGPLLWGLDKPVSDLSRGCTIQEIVDTALCVSKLTRGRN